MNKTLLIIALLFAGISMSNAQSDDILTRMGNDKKFKADYEKAEVLLLDYNFEEAVKTYLKWDSVYSGNANLQYKIGFCYANMGSEKPRAIPFLEKASSMVVKEYTGEYNEMNAPVDVFMYLGIVYHVDYKFNKAIDNYDKFIKYAEFDSPELVDSVKTLKEKSYNAIKIINNPLSIKIENLGNPINTGFSEYSPIITTDMKTLYFTSRREGSTGGKKDAKGLYYEDVYFTSINNDGQWSVAKHIGGKINTIGHEATISISPDGKTILLYKDDKGDGNIYFSELLNENEWSKPEKMPEPINSTYWETHACYSPDMNIIFFVSNRPGGFGGRDIWMTEKINGKWMEPENLGSTINTQYDEDSPYMLPDGFTLYFSSQAHDNMGGFDIFISTRTEDGFWTTPENMGYPVNTTEDDVFYIPTPDEKHAFYSSAKNYGKGGQDIYYMTIVKAKKKTIKLRGRVADANSFKALEASIEFYSNGKEMVISSLTSAEDGSYVTTLLLGDSYEIKAKADGYKMATYDLSVLEDEKRDELVLDIFLSKLLLAGDTAKANIEDVRVGEKIVLNNIFYDFDRATLRPESVEELNRLIKLMKDIPSLKIELSSHTDNVGSDEYNMKLSNERAKSVVSFLVASGIASDRLVAKGYGETQPLATNTSEEGRQANRRTEFKILSK